MSNSKRKKGKFTFSDEWLEDVLLELQEDQEAYKNSEDYKKYKKEFNEKFNKKYKEKYGEYPPEKDDEDRLFEKNEKRLTKEEKSLYDEMLQNAKDIRNKDSWMREFWGNKIIIDSEDRKKMKEKCKEKCKEKYKEKYGEYPPEEDDGDVLFYYHCCD